MDTLPDLCHTCPLWADHECHAYFSCPERETEAMREVIYWQEYNYIESQREEEYR